MSKNGWHKTYDLRVIRISPFWVVWAGIEYLGKNEGERKKKKAWTTREINSERLNLRQIGLHPFHREACLETHLSNPAQALHFAKECSMLQGLPIPFLDVEDCIYSVGRLIDPKQGRRMIWSLVVAT